MASSDNSNRGERMVALTLREAEAMRNAIMGDHFDTKQLDSAIAEINAVREMQETKHDSDF